MSPTSNSQPHLASAKGINSLENTSCAITEPLVAPSFSIVSFNFEHNIYFIPQYLR